MSGQSMHDIRGGNFLIRIFATAGIALRAIEYIWVSSTVLADGFSDAGLLRVDCCSYVHLMVDRKWFDDITKNKAISMTFWLVNSDRG